jgi:hypothetical protein
MSRLISVERASECPSSLTVKAGDVLLFAATGARVRSGSDVVAIWGPFVPGVVGDNGQVFSPAASPNAVIVMARRTGRAAVEVITGDPWHATQSTSLDIIVQGEDD